MSADIPGVSWGQHGPSSRTDDSDASCEGSSRAPKRYHSGCSEDMYFHLTQLKRKQDLAFSPVCLRGVHCRPHLGQNLAQPPSLVGFPLRTPWGPSCLSTAALLRRSPSWTPSLVHPASPDLTHPHVTARGEAALRHPSGQRIAREHHNEERASCRPEGPFPRRCSVRVLSDTDLRLPGSLS